MTVRLAYLIIALVALIVAATAVNPNLGGSVPSGDPPRPVHTYAPGFTP